MTASSSPGAGAWQRPRWYSTGTCGASVAGADDADRQRIRLAAGAVQRELSLLGYVPKTARHDGHFGSLTDEAIRRFQHEHGLAADGAAGPLTLRRMCVPLLNAYEAFGVPDHLLRGLIWLESDFDPGAEGVDRTHGTDMGLAQVNDEANPSVSRAQAFGDIRWSINYAAGRFFNARRRASDTQTYAELGRWECAVADHNNPSKADAWFDSGEPPDEQIAIYVQRVRALGARMP